MITLNQPIFISRSMGRVVLIPTNYQGWGLSFVRERIKLTAPFPSLVVGDFNPGLSISFNQTTGHALGQLSFADLDNVVVPISTQTGQVGILRTRDALHQAIEQQKDLDFFPLEHPQRNLSQVLHIRWTV